MDSEESHNLPGLLEDTKVKGFELESEARPRGRFYIRLTSL